MEWFLSIARNIGDSIENWIYTLEAGGFDMAAFSIRITRIAKLLPIFFIIFLVLDMAIRSRFVRYSYRDENQAKKSVWWRWQSDEDAALALDAGMSGPAMLAQNAGEDGAFAAEDLQDETQAPMQESMQTDDAAPEDAQIEDAAAEDAQIEEADDARSEEPVQEETQDTAQQQADDHIDRGPIVSAKQNRVRSTTLAGDRARGLLTDLRDRLTIAKSALVFIPAAIARAVRMNRLKKKNAAAFKRTLRQNKRIARINKKAQAAQAKAIAEQKVTGNYIDGDYEAAQDVTTGGIEGVSFEAAAEMLKNAAAEEAESAQETAQEPVQEDANEAAEETVMQEEAEAAEPAQETASEEAQPTKKQLRAQAKAEKKAAKLAKKEEKKAARLAKKEAKKNKDAEAEELAKELAAEPAEEPAAEPSNKPAAEPAQEPSNEVTEENTTEA